MSYIDRLLKKPNIIKASGFPFNNKEYDSEDIKNLLYKKGRTNYSAFPNEIKSLVISDHAHKRWNERVGPYIGYQELLNLLNQLLLLRDRIRFVSDVRGLIDSDIIFYYKVRQNTIYITTFYGRLSLHPVLSNIRELKGFLAKKDEKIDFKMNESILRKQILPPVPMEFIEFNGHTTLYHLEKYKVHTSQKEAEDLYFLTEFKRTDINHDFEINPNQPMRPLLTKSVLYIMKKLGYSQFVKDHLQYHKPLSVERAIEKYQEQLKKKEQEGAKS